MEDKPSILAAFIRVLLGAAFIVVGADRYSKHAAAASDLDRWGLPSPSATAYLLGGLEIVCGVLLLIGLVPRLAALLLGLDALAMLLTAGRTDGGLQWALWGVLLFFSLVVVAAGGGRWALIDRIDPAPPRRLVRE
jgi:putative oxidoreductase